MIGRSASAFGRCEATEAEAEVELGIADPAAWAACVSCDATSGEFVYQAVTASAGAQVHKIRPELMWLMWHGLLQCSLLPKFYLNVINKYQQDKNGGTRDTTYLTLRHYRSWTVAETARCLCAAAQHSSRQVCFSSLCDGHGASGLNRWRRPCSCGDAVDGEVSA